jgi:hypothetical protein
MPLFDYVCPVCHREVRDVLLPLPDRLLDIGCDDCSVVMLRRFPLPNVIPNYADLDHFGKPQYTDYRRKVCGCDV